MFCINHRTNRASLFDVYILNKTRLLLSETIRNDGRSGRKRIVFWGGFWPVIPSLIVMSTGKKTIQALFFDFDGVILETEEPGYWGWQKTYAEQGQELKLEQFALVIGTHFLHFDPKKDLEAKVGHALDWERLDRERREFYSHIIAKQPVLPGVIDLIHEARSAGVTVAIVSSSPREWIDHWLNHTRMKDQFDYVMCVDEVPTPKPAPDLYQAALRRFRLSADEAVAIEDSPNGSKAAQAAGLFCLIVPSEITARLKFEVDFPRVDSLAGMTLARLDGMKAAHRARR
jgi:HAD superfamily hydrolase (TIGR01509 family)